MEGPGEAAKQDMRALYKDLVWLICKGTLICPVKLRSKGEPSYLGDRRLYFKSLTRGRLYVEDREFYHSPTKTRIEFRFITQVLSEETRSMLKFFASKPSQAPAVLLINSTVWDLTRWGPQGDLKFREDLRELMRLCHSKLPSSTLLVWLTALQPAAKLRSSALIVKQLEQFQNSLQFQIMEANVYAASLAKEYGFDVLDFHYYTRLLSHRRRPDGIHYNRALVRYLSNLVLTHIGEVWEVKLPGKMKHRDIDFVVEAKAAQSRSRKADCKDVENKARKRKANSIDEENEDGSNRVETAKPVLKAKRRKQPVDSDERESLLNDLVDKCAEGFMRDIDQEQSTDVTHSVDEYFKSLLSNVSEHRGNMAPRVRRPLGARDPGSVEFHEDDISWERPPGKWNHTKPVWEQRKQRSGFNNQPTPYMFNQPNSASNMGMPFTNAPAHGVFQFNANNAYTNLSQRNNYHQRFNTVVSNTIRSDIDPFGIVCGNNFAGVQSVGGFPPMQNLVRNIQGAICDSLNNHLGRQSRWNQK